MTKIQIVWPLSYGAILLQNSEGCQYDKPNLNGEIQKSSYEDAAVLEKKTKAQYIQ